MASTREGKELTEANRRGQITLAASVEAVARETDRLIDLSDLDGSFPQWYAANERLVTSGRATSTRLASAYVEAFGRAEADVRLSPDIPVFDRAQLVSQMEVTAVAAVKARVAEGMPVEEAWRIQSAMAYAGFAQNVLNAGRTVVTTTDFRYSGKKGRWRRVGDGAPCAFCGMLIGRGPVYVENTAYFRAHGHCGCTAELVFDDWEPTETESLMRASYLQAAMDASDEYGPKWARKADGESQILYRMRRNSPTLFNDGVLPKPE